MKGDFGLVADSVLDSLRGLEVEPPIADSAGLVWWEVDIRGVVSSQETRSLSGGTTWLVLRRGTWRAKDCGGGPDACPSETEV